MKNITVLLLFILSILSYAKITYTVDEDKCIGCTLCVKSCPVKAITMVDGKAVIDLTKCIGCGICVNGDGKDFNGCPVKAIDKNEKKEVKTKTIYTVNADKCIGCTLCVKPCPVKAITMVDGKAVIDLTKCIGCGICVNGDGKDFNGCPVKAIDKKTVEIK